MKQHTAAGFVKLPEAKARGKQVCKSMQAHGFTHLFLCCQLQP
ncbi:hypothetical protein HMPREF1548_02073 [Clostridium sp. KLE 1755]|nr:hypothetical protein HMPREF1548_02073 [Clostridium sp. KLE 1755]